MTALQVGVASLLVLGVVALWVLPGAALWDLYQWTHRRDSHAFDRLMSWLHELHERRSHE